MAAVQERREPVLGPCGEAHHFLALGDHRPQVAHCFRWNPHPFEHADRVELCQGEGRFLVGLDLHSGDEGDVGRMYGDERMDVRGDHIMEQVGVDGHFDHYSIGGQQEFLGPGFELVVGDGLRAKNDLHLGIDPDGDKISFVDVEPDETGWREHVILL